VVLLPATQHHCHVAGAKLYCFITDAYEQLAQGNYMNVEQPVKSVTFGSQVWCLNHHNIHIPLHHSDCRRHNRKDLRYLL